MSYLYSFVVCLFIVNGGGLIALLGGAGLSAVVCLWLCGFCFVLFCCCCFFVVVFFWGVSSSSGCLGGLRCFVVALPGPSMWLFFKIYDDTVTFCVHCICKESKNSINRPDYVIKEKSYQQ